VTRVAAWTFFISVLGLAGCLFGDGLHALGAPWWFSLLGCCVLGYAIGRVWPQRWLP
jgi:hypothetical protein